MSKVKPTENFDAVVAAYRAIVSGTNERIRKLSALAALPDRIAAHRLLATCPDSFFEQWEAKNARRVRAFREGADALEKVPGSRSRNRQKA